MLPRAILTPKPRPAMLDHAARQEFAELWRNGVVEDFRLRRYERIEPDASETSSEGLACRAGRREAAWSDCDDVRR